MCMPRLTKSVFCFSNASNPQSRTIGLSVPPEISTTPIEPTGSLCPSVGASPSLTTSNRLPSCVNLIMSGLKPTSTLEILFPSRSKKLTEPRTSLLLGWLAIAITLPPTATLFSPNCRMVLNCSGLVGSAMLMHSNPSALLVNHNLLFTESYAGISAPDMFHQLVWKRLSACNFKAHSTVAPEGTLADDGGVPKSIAHAHTTKR